LICFWGLKRKLLKTHLDELEMKRGSNFRDWIPKPFLEGIRAVRRRVKRSKIERQIEVGSALEASTLVEDFRSMGLLAGDSVLFHSSLSKIGAVRGGASTAVDALLETLGSGGCLMMPSSSVRGLQSEYAKAKPVFDLQKTPSAMGAISENFRTRPGVVRSLHPTESVCASGLRAAYLVADHPRDIRPYGPDSPWRRWMEVGGKVLYAGVTLDQAGTSLHCVEDELGLDFMYLPDPVEFKTIDSEGRERSVKTKIHNPQWSAQRRCDGLIGLLESSGALVRTRLGAAECLLLDAARMLEVLTRAYRERGVSLYQPEGR